MNKNAKPWFEMNQREKKIKLIQISIGLVSCQGFLVIFIIADAEYRFSNVPIILGNEIRRKTEYHDWHPSPKDFFDID